MCVMITALRLACGTPACSKRPIGLPPQSIITAPPGPCSTMYVFSCEASGTAAEVPSKTSLAMRVRPPSASQRSGQQARCNVGLDDRGNDQQGHYDKHQNLRVIGQ